MIPRSLIAAALLLFPLITARADVRVEITRPPDGFQLFINETLPVQATMAPSNNLTLRWTATDGSYTDTEGTATTFIGPSSINDLTTTIFLKATAWGDRPLSSAQVASASPKVLATPATLILLADAIDDVSTTAPAVAPAVDYAVELDYYRSSGWYSRLGEPFSPQWLHEIYEGNHAPDRDSRAAHFQNALKIRPNHPTNIALEFRLAILLGQNVDPAHNQTVRPAEAQAISEHIVATYDHKTYYRDESEGVSESLEYMVPRAAIWASSYSTAITHDRAAAQKYAAIALDSFYWTSQKRRDAWLNAPKPQPVIPLEFNHPGAHEAAVKQWEEKQVQAAAGTVLGPYATGFCDAAVNVYVKAFAETLDDVPRTLHEILDKCPNSQLAFAAQTRLDKLAAAPPRPTAPAPVTPAPPATPPATLPLPAPTPLAQTPSVTPWLPFLLAALAVATLLAACFAFLRRSRPR